MGFSRQKKKKKYWSGLPRSPPGDLPGPGVEPVSPVAPALQVDFLLLSHWGNLTNPQENANQSHNEMPPYIR